MERQCETTKHYPANETQIQHCLTGLNVVAALRKAWNCKASANGNKKHNNHEPESFEAWVCARVTYSNVSQNHQEEREKIDRYVDLRSHFSNTKASETIQNISDITKHLKLFSYIKIQSCQRDSVLDFENHVCNNLCVFEQSKSRFSLENEFSAGLCAELYSMSSIYNFCCFH